MRHRPPQLTKQGIEQLVEVTLDARMDIISQLGQALTLRNIPDRVALETVRNILRKNQVVYQKYLVELRAK